MTDRGTISNLRYPAKKIVQGGGGGVANGASGFFYGISRKSGATYYPIRLAPYHGASLGVDIYDDGTNYAIVETDVWASAPTAERLQVSRFRKSDGGDASSQYMESAGSGGNAQYFYVTRPLLLNGVLYSHIYPQYYQHNVESYLSGIRLSDMSNVMKLYCESYGGMMYRALCSDNSRYLYVFAYDAYNNNSTKILKVDTLAPTAKVYYKQCFNQITNVTDAVVRSGDGYIYACAYYGAYAYIVKVRASDGVMTGHKRFQIGSDSTTVNIPLSITERSNGNLLIIGYCNPGSIVGNIGFMIEFDSSLNVVACKRCEQTETTVGAMYRPVAYGTGYIVRTQQGLLLLDSDLAPTKNIKTENFCRGLSYESATDKLIVQCDFRESTLLYGAGAKAMILHKEISDFSKFAGTMADESNLVYFQEIPIPYFADISAVVDTSLSSVTTEYWNVGAWAGMGAGYSVERKADVDFE